MGLSLLGVIVVGIILLPNIFFFIIKPNKLPKVQPKVNFLASLLENIGRIGCLVLPLIFGLDVERSPFNIFTAIMIFAVIMYYICWIRYFFKGRTYSLLFKPLGLIPIPLAVFPAIYFIALSFWIQSPILGVLAVIFTIAHLHNSWQNYKITDN